VSITEKYHNSAPEEAVTSRELLKIPLIICLYGPHNPADFICITLSYPFFLMAITGPSSYIPGINSFLPHWAEANLVQAASGKNGRTHCPDS